jgi:hypothetical protein
MKHEKHRNPYALLARMRNGAGYHRHPKWEASRNACKKPLKEENDQEAEELEWFFDQEEEA